MGFTAAGAADFMAVVVAGVFTVADPMLVPSCRPQRIRAADLFAARPRKYHPVDRATSNASARFLVLARISRAIRSSLLREKLGPLKTALAAFS
ncbi:MAG: hypothetical protein ACYC92_06195 [Candidatus Acidiferrales bacterium]